MHQCFYATDSKSHNINSPARGCRDGSWVSKQLGTGTWYNELQKPEWNPPSWVFGPVWTMLYILMGIACYRVWRAPATPARRAALSLYSVQLLLNLAWSFIFFSAHQTGWAFAELLILWVMIILTIFAFTRIDKVAPWLLLPYISWVSFAAILNYTIWQMNS